MPRMRDRQTRVVRDVPQQTLDRWPDDYEPVEQPKAAKAPKKAPAKRKRPSRPATTTTTRATPPASPVPAEGTDTKGEVA